MSSAVNQERRTTTNNNHAVENLQSAHLDCMIRGAATQVRESDEDDFRVIENTI